MESKSGHAGICGPRVLEFFLLGSTVIGETLNRSLQLKQMCHQDVADLRSVLETPAGMLLC